MNTSEHDLHQWTLKAIKYDSQMHGPWSQPAWTEILALPVYHLNGIQVTKGRQLDLSLSQFPCV